MMTTATTSLGLADLLDINPQQAAGLYTLALKQLRDGETPAAAQTLHELALLRPCDVALLPLQAALALALHRPGEAVRMLGQLLRLNLGDSPAARGAGV
jgi:predicted Zn-dependent protease